MKAVLLISGGIDSPVAGWLIKRHGVEVIGLHCSHEPFTDNHAERKSKAAADILGIPLHSIIIGPQLAEIAKRCDQRYYFILQKRLLLRCAEGFASQNGAAAIITGENLGQVGSQTLSNLTVIQQSVRLPVWRPLLCYDKREIIALAKKIRTYEVSTGPEICGLLGPKHPATSSKIERIETEEMRVDAALLVKEAMKTLKPSNAEPAKPQYSTDSIQPRACKI